MFTSVYFFIQTKFKISEKGQKWVIMSIGRKWREFKSRIKKLHFNNHMTYQERIADCDTRVHPSAWEFLVKHWSSETGQVSRFKY